MTSEDISKINVKVLQEGGMVMRGTWVCMTKDLGVHNNAFGGILLSHIDEVAAAFSNEICDTPLMVTRSLNAEFLAPIKVGNIVKTYCGIEKIGNTSLTIIVEMRKYNVRNENEIICLRVKTTFVRIDEEGTSIPIGDSIKQKYNAFALK